MEHHGPSSRLPLLSSPPLAGTWPKRDRRAKPCGVFGCGNFDGGATTWTILDTFPQRKASFNFFETPPCPLPAFRTRVTARKRGRITHGGQGTSQQQWIIIAGWTRHYRGNRGKVSAIAAVISDKWSVGMVVCSHIFLYSRKKGDGEKTLSLSHGIGGSTSSRLQRR